MKILFPFATPDRSFRKVLGVRILQAYEMDKSDRRSLLTFFGPLAVLSAVIVFFVSYTRDTPLSLTTPLLEQPQIVSLATFSEIDQETTELDFMVDSDTELDDAIEFREL